MTLLLPEGIAGRAPRRITVAEYLADIEADRFHPDSRAELIDGLIVERTPIGTAHSYATRTLRLLLTHRLTDTYVVGSQEPILLPPDSRPEPDLWLAAPPSGQYGRRDPEPADLALVVEVADSSFEFDYGKKRPLYAVAEIREYWIVDLQHRRLIVSTEPDGLGAYAKTSEYDDTETLHHDRFGAVSVAVFVAD